MRVTHREIIHARCPVEPEVWDYYEVAFETEALVEVERVRGVLREFAGRAIYQEDLTQRLATLTQCVVTTTGLHRTTRTTVTCEP